MSNDELYDQALKAIQRLFSDQSVSDSETREQLEGLIEEIEIMISTLPEKES